MMWGSQWSPSPAGSCGPQEGGVVGAPQSSPPPIDGRRGVPGGAGSAEGTLRFLPPTEGGNEVTSLSPSRRVRDVTLWSQQTEVAVRNGGGG